MGLPLPKLAILCLALLSVDLVALSCEVEIRRSIQWMLLWFGMKARASPWHSRTAQFESRFWVLPERLATLVSNSFMASGETRMVATSTLHRVCWTPVVRSERERSFACGSFCRAWDPAAITNGSALVVLSKGTLTDDQVQGP